MLYTLESVYLCDMEDFNCALSRGDQGGDVQGYQGHLPPTPTRDYNILSYLHNHS